MHKTIIGIGVAVSVSAAVVPSMAESTATLYGKLDVFVEIGHGDRTRVSVESGGLSGSRVGFKGSEDLGTGLKSVFQIESGINVDTGTVGQGNVFWGRQAFVGLAGSLGTLTLGRQYLPVFAALDATDPFGTGAGSAAESGIVSSTTRANNSIAYTSPAVGDLTLSSMYALGEAANGSNSRNSLYSADLRYAAGPLNIGVSAMRKERLSDTDANTSYVLVSGGFDFRSFRLTGGFQSVKGAQDRLEYYAGGVIPVGSLTSLTAGLAGGEARQAQGKDSCVKENSAGIGWFYPAAGTSKAEPICLLRLTSSP
jgi:predicted porin